MECPLVLVSKPLHRLWKNWRTGSFHFIPFHSAVDFVSHPTSVIHVFFDTVLTSFEEIDRQWGLLVVHVQIIIKARLKDLSGSPPHKQYITLDDLPPNSISFAFLTAVAVCRTSFHRTKAQIRVQYCTVVYNLPCRVSALMILHPSPSSTRSICFIRLHYLTISKSVLYLFDHLKAIT